MAKWSSIWSEKHLSRDIKERIVDTTRFTEPTIKPAKKGKYPHLQPFFRNRKQEVPLKIAA